MDAGSNIEQVRPNNLPRLAGMQYATLSNRRLPQQFLTDHQAGIRTHQNCRVAFPVIDQRHGTQPNSFTVAGAVAA